MTSHTIHKYIIINELAEFRNTLVCYVTSNILGIWYIILYNSADDYLTKLSKH